MNSCLLFMLFAFNLVNSAPREINNAPVLLISMDGFSAIKLNEFLANNPESALKKRFVDVGVKADYMIPTFPSLTFPNHFSIVTGLHNENHGITGNTFYDPSSKTKINLISSNNALDAQWWNRSEPIWLTAKKQGLKTSSFFWVGSEVWTRTPDVFLTYKKSYSFLSRCDEVVNWIKKLKMDFVTLYFDEPDHVGHESGPNSDDYNQQLLEMDKVVDYLLKRLEEENILDSLNIIIVSDHGMAEMVDPKNNGTQIISNYVNMSLVDTTKTIYGVVANIYPKSEENTEELINSLKKIPHLQVFRKEDTPPSFHYQNSDRIAPIVTISDEGYTLSSTNQTLKGNHGFNNSLESMRAIFLARGPSFVPNEKINGFKNVDVYPLLCDLLNIQCNPNNGTIDSFQNALIKDFSSVSTSDFTKVTSKSNNASNCYKNNTLNLVSFLLVFFFFKFY